MSKLHRHEVSLQALFSNCSPTRDIEVAPLVYEITSKRMKEYKLYAFQIPRLDGESRVQMGSGALGVCQCVAVE